MGHPRNIVSGEQGCDFRETNNIQFSQMSAVAQVFGVTRLEVKALY